jgi:hypothetical protein
MTLGLSYEPPCSLCHVKGNTGSGTAQTPFAISMEARGLTAGGRSSVSAALTQLRQDQVDSDGDGVTDSDELLAGTDPNSVENGDIQADGDPSYGCEIVRGRAISPGTCLLFAVFAFLAARRRLDRMTRDETSS